MNVVSIKKYLLKVKNGRYMKCSAVKICIVYVFIKNLCNVTNLKKSKTYYFEFSIFLQVSYG